MRDIYDLPPHSSILDLMWSFTNPLTDQVCRDSLKYDFQPCTDTCNISVTVNNITICKGTTGTLTAAVLSTYCTATSTKYLWSTGATTASISVTTGGLYCVTVTDCKGCKASTCATVTEYAKPRINCPPDTSLCAGQTLIINQELTTVNTIAGGCPTTYKWYHNTQIISDEFSFILQNVTIADAGKYCLVATNCCGSDTCCFYLTVNTPPVIICPPNQSACTGEKVEFSPELPGGTIENGCPTTYSWYFNGTFISNSFSLIINPVTIANEGEYCIIASNCCGADTCCFFLTVNKAPVIICPQNKTVCAGQEVILSPLLPGGTDTDKIVRQHIAGISTAILLPIRFH